MKRPLGDGELMTLLVLAAFCFLISMWLTVYSEWIR